VPKQSQATPKGQAASKKAPAAPKPKGSAQRPAQASGKPTQSSAQTASQPIMKERATLAPKTATPPAPKAATPPAPKPRDPSVARRDERREERRLEIQARQQERRLELHRAKRQKIIIRYDLIIAPILLIGLVAFFSVTRHPIDALISGLIVAFAGFTLLGFAAFMPGARTRRPARSRPTELTELTELTDDTASTSAAPDGAALPEQPLGDPTDNEPGEQTRSQ